MPPFGPRDLPVPRSPGPPSSGILRALHHERSACRIGTALDGLDRPFSAVYEVWFSDHLRSWVAAAIVGRNAAAPLHAQQPSDRAVPDKPLDFGDVVCRGNDGKTGPSRRHDPLGAALAESGAGMRSRTWATDIGRSPLRARFLPLASQKVEAVYPPLRAMIPRRSGTLSGSVGSPMRAARGRS